MRTSGIRATSAKRARLSPWAGLAIAIAGYLLLSLRQPPAWSTPVWAVLAFLVVPGTVGCAIGWMQGGGGTFRGRFWTAAWAAGSAMFLYSAVTLIALRARVGSSADSSAVFLVGVFVTLVYTAVAGLVAGAASALPGRRLSARRDA